MERASLSGRADRAPSLDEARIALLTDEAGLIERVRRGDRGAFGAIFSAYAGPLYVYTDRLTRSRAVAEELVHDVFVRIWEIRAEWRVDSLGAYLYGAVRRRALNHLRRQALHGAWEEREAPALSDAQAESPEDQILATDLASAAARALERLSPRNREAYLLHRQHHLTYAEIAVVLGVTPKAVERQIGRALQALRALLAGYLALVFIIGR
jgi:RNA polymerase sigma-70 factor, ECF subfamily